MALHPELLGIAQRRIREALECVATAAAGVSEDEANAERLDYVARAIVMLNDAFSLTRSAVNGSVPALLTRDTREAQALAVRQMIDRESARLAG